MGDFGVRKYDEDNGRFVSIDPLWEKYRSLSPYNYCGNNPLSIIDPSGKSGQGYIDKENQTVTISSHIYFYGESATKELAGAIANEMACRWNEVGGTVNIDGMDYKVQFNITYEVVIRDKALSLSSSNKDIRNNFIRIENTVPKEGSSWWKGNHGYFYTGDFTNPKNGGTTPAHELGHGLGISLHSSWQEGRSTGTPDIMVGGESLPRNRWSEQEVMQKNISSIFTTPYNTHMNGTSQLSDKAVVNFGFLNKDSLP